MRMLSFGPARNAVGTTKSATPTMKVVSKEEQVKPPKAMPQSSPPGIFPCYSLSSIKSTISFLLVGPGASKEGEYKNPEYYQYNPMSFYDIEKDMASYRLKQPSNKQ